ncbi:hypothetical protein F4805DRAFT_338118 [Annulohypoxylon moriforme]|nr:hypothetical protein F4805DRAFT_338118 [Annulohypoxylon moriforme]
MDGVSGAASILSIIDLSAKICKYILHVRDAPKERKRLYNGIRDCSEILKIIEASILDFDRAEGSITSHIFVSLHTPLDQLDHTLRYLATKLSCKDDNNPPTKCTEDNSTVDYNPRDLMKDRFGKLFDSFKKSFSNKQIIRKPFIDVSRNLTWPLKESDTDRVLKDIESKKSNLQLAMQHNHQQLLLGVKEISVHNQERLKQSIDTLFNRDKLRDVLEWCKAIEYGEQQERLRSSRTAGTETRLDNEQSFKDWFESSRQTLVCFGHPGVGKTFLTSSVVDKVISLSEQTSTSLLNQTMDIGFAYIYCDIKNEPDQEADKLTASLFKQLIRGCRCLPKAVTDLYEMIGCNNPRQPTGTELLELLPSILALYSRVFIVIDALDTCEVVHRNTFLETILQLQEKHPINIFATTRPFPEQSLKALFADRPWRQETIVARDEDIHLYVNSTVSKLAPCADQNPELLVEIKAKVTEAANGM